MNFASYWFSDKIVLSMYGAREVSVNEAPDLYRLVQRWHSAPAFPCRASISFRAMRRTPSQPGAIPSMERWP